MSSVAKEVIPGNSDESIYEIMERCALSEEDEIKLKNFVESKVLEKNDIILLASGGHGFKMLENSEIIEVKQGPYCGEEDKVRFRSHDN